MKRAVVPTYFTTDAQLKLIHEWLNLYPDYFVEVQDLDPLPFVLLVFTEDEL